MILTDAQRELLEDKFLVWERQAREGPPDLRDYNARAAEALKIALSIVSGALAAEAQVSALQAQVDGLREGIEPFSSAYDQIVADHGLDWFPDEGVAVRSALAYPVANASVVWRHFRLASEATKAALSQPPADEPAKGEE